MPCGYHPLTYAERCQIHALKKSGLSIRGMAHQLERSPGTISREIVRNRGGRGTRHRQAQARSEARRRAASKVPRKRTPERWEQVEEGLRAGWSPEQTAGRYRQQGEVMAGREWIYRYVRADRQSGGTLHRCLRRRGKKPNWKGGRHAGRGHIPGRVDISKRPAVVDGKSRIGDWELDTILGSKHRGALHFRVEVGQQFPTGNYFLPDSGQKLFFARKVLPGDKVPGGRTTAGKSRAVCTRKTSLEHAGSRPPVRAHGGMPGNPMEPASPAAGPVCIAHRPDFPPQRTAAVPACPGRLEDRTAAFPVVETPWISPHPRKFPPWRTFPEDLSGKSGKEPSGTDRMRRPQRSGGSDDPGRDGRHALPNRAESLNRREAIPGKQVWRRTANCASFPVGGFSGMCDCMPGPLAACPSVQGLHRRWRFPAKWGTGDSPRKPYPIHGLVPKARRMLGSLDFEHPET